LVLYLYHIGIVGQDSHIFLIEMRKKNGFFD